MIYLYDYPKLQVTITWIHTLVFLAWLIHTKPFAKAEMNWLSIFSEIVTCLVFAELSLYLFDKTLEMRSLIGFYVIYTTLSIVAVSFVVVMGIQFYELVKYCQKRGRADTMVPANSPLNSTELLSPKSTEMLSPKSIVSASPSRAVQGFSSGTRLERVGTDRPPKTKVATIESEENENMRRNNVKGSTTVNYIMDEEDAAKELGVLFHVPEFS